MWVWRIVGVMNKKYNRAERMVYRLHNSGKVVGVGLMQWLAGVAQRNGSSAIMVQAYANGNSNGR